MPKESYRSDLRIERYENWKKTDWVSIFRGQRRKKKEKEKKNGRRAAEGGDRRRTRVDHRLEKRSSSDASTRVACKPGRTATRAEPTGPDQAGPADRDYVEASARAACDWRLPVRVATHSQRAARALARVERPIWPGCFLFARFLSRFQF